MLVLVERKLHDLQNYVRLTLHLTFIFTCFLRPLGNYMMCRAITVIMTARVNVSIRIDAGICFCGTCAPYVNMNKDLMNKCIISCIASVSLMVIIRTSL